MKVSCKNCHKEFDKLPNQIKKSKNHFCSRSCAATYNNKHVNRKHGPAPQSKCRMCDTAITCKKTYCSVICKQKGKENREPIQKPRIKGVIGPVPFNNYWVYGPYLHKKIQRNMIFLIPTNPSKPRTTISYARYIMSVHLKRQLKPHEQVDHRDENRTNDSLNNLQILSRQENTQKYIRGDTSPRKTLILLRCPECLQEFIRPRNQTHLLGFKKATFCSRECVGKFGGRRNRQEDISDRLEGQVIKIYRDTK